MSLLAREDADHAEFVGELVAARVTDFNVDIAPGIYLDEPTYVFIDSMWMADTTRIDRRFIIPYTRGTQALGHADSFLANLADHELYANYTKPSNR